MIVHVDDVYSFKKCQLRYHLNKLGEVTVKERGLSQEHKLFDHLLKYYFEQLQQGNVLDFQQMKKKLSNMLYHKSNYNLLDPDKKKTRRREVKLIEYLRTFMEYESTISQKVVGVDVSFSMPFSPTFILEGSIPLVRVVDGKAEMVVFKITKNALDTVYAETDFSLTAYAMAFQIMFQRAPDVIKIYHLPTKSVYKTKRESRHFKRVKNFMKEMERTIKEGSYYTSESFLCPSCNARYACMRW